MKKVLILHTSVGLGHKSIAENIAYHLQAHGYEVRLYDIASLEPGKFADSLVGLHQFINRRLPWLWNWLYKSSIINAFIGSLRLPLAARQSGGTFKVIIQFQPDLVITTQTTASAVVAYLKQKGLYKNLFAIAFSDYHLHPFWLYEQADFYLANTLEQKSAMMLLAVPAEKIFVCGVTLKSKPQADISAIKKRLGIGRSDKVVLFASGSLGVGGLKSEVLKILISRLKERLAAYGWGLKFFVLCGKNQNLRKLLKNKLGGMAEVLGFYGPMSELYAVADLFITKPGGLTVAESLQWNLPMLVTHLLPGQEEMNYKYLKDQGLIIPGLHLSESSLIDFILGETCRELLSQNFKHSLQANPSKYAVIDGKHAGAACLEAIYEMFHRV